MPYITCLSEEMRDALRDSLEQMGASRAHLAAIQQMPLCSIGHIGFDPHGKGGGKGRRSNPRAKWVGGCIKEEYAKKKRPVPELMKLCSTRYREQQK